MWVGGTLASDTPRLPPKPKESERGSHATAEMATNHEEAKDERGEKLVEGGDLVSIVIMPHQAAYFSLCVL